MTDFAINDKGDALFFDGQQWKPAPIAESPSGDRMAFDGKEWRALPKAESKVPGMETAKSVADTVNTGVNWLGTQFTKGVTGIAGAPRAVGDLNARIAEWVGDKVGAPQTGKAVGSVLRHAVPGFGFTPSAEDLNKMVFGQLGVPEVNAGDNPALTLTNPFGLDGKVNVGKMLDVGAQAIPGAIAGPATGGAARAIPAFTGGVTSEAAGQATEGTPYELPARIFGALPGAWMGAKIATPLPARLTPEEARNVAIAKENNIPLTVGQETGRGRTVESALSRFPTSAGVMADAADDQARAVNTAALKTAGARGDRLDPPTMSAAQRQASDAFEVAKKFPEDITLSPDFFNKAGQKVAEYLDNTSASSVIPSVKKRLDDFYDPKLMKGGNYPQLTNEQYQEFRHGINTALQNTTEGGAKQALKGLRDALDDAAEASLPADKVAAWQEARKHWGNLKILNKAAAGGTVQSRREGDLSPSSLSAALRTAQGPDKFARVKGGLNDIARVAGFTADTMPNSGTPQTLQMQRLLSGGGLASGAGAGFMVGGIPGAAIGLGTMAAPNLVARAMTGRGAISRQVRNYLANQALADPRAAIATVPFTLAPNLLTDQRVAR